MKSQNLLISGLFLFLCFSTSITFAQKNEKQNPNTITIEAVVLDKDTEEALPFTNVIIEGSSIGTITNEEGKFELTISNKFKSSNVIFSFIGYENSAIPVKKFKTPGKKVFLKTSSESLDEIVLTAKNKYREIVNEAIGLIPQNYPQTPLELQVYYRELTKTDDNYTKFSDAASMLYYSGYDNKFDKLLSNTDYIRFNRIEKNINQVPFPEPREFIIDNRDQAKIIALRKSNNLKDYKILEQSEKLKSIDTTNLKWLESNDIGGGPLRLTGADKVKRKEDFLNPKTNSNYIYTLKKRSTYDDHPVYQILFKPNDSTSSPGKYRGEITIDIDSKAIISYDYKLSRKAKKRLNQRFAASLKTPKDVEEKSKKAFITRVISLKDYHVYVWFSNYNNKWYLKHIKAVNEYHNSGDLFEDYTVTTESELIVNTVTTEYVTRFNDSTVFRNNFTNSLFKYELPYNSEFWTNFSTLLPTGVVGKALEDLEAKGSLESQFEEKK